MLLPPFTPDPEDARPYFRRLRDVRDELAGRGVPPAMLRELSMGMSHDFEVADRRRRHPRAGGHGHLRRALRAARLARSRATQEQT